MGCGSKVKLAAIPSPYLSLYLPTQGDTVGLRILPHARLEDDCKLLAPDTRATLNGVALERMRGEQHSDDLAYNRDCIVEFTGSIDAIPKPSPRASFRIWDDSASWNFELPTAFAPRSFALVSPNRPNIRRGEKLSLKWSTPSDSLDRRWIGFELYRAGSAPGTGTAVQDVAINGADLSLTIPTTSESDKAWNGAGLLRFFGPEGVKPELKSCPVGSCSVTMDFSVPALPVTVEN